MTKKIIGSEEWCALPSLDIPAIKARTDSGAKTSSIHAFNIKPYEENGELWVRFEVHPIQGDRKTTVKCRSKVVDERFITNTSGRSQKRYVIKEQLKLGDETWDIELNLANRASMGYRMLLGRQAMMDRLIVDPSVSFCSGDITIKQLEKMYKHSMNKVNGLKIALLASNRELYSNKRLMQAAKERGHDITFLNVEDCFMKLDVSKPEVFSISKRDLGKFDAIIPRISPSITFYGTAVLRQFESMNILCLNSSLSIKQSRDKLFASQIFVTNRLDTPKTCFANSSLDTDELVELAGGPPLIIKLLEGSQGMGVVLAETKKAAISVIDGFKILNANILVQEFIKEAKGTDIRCFVVDGKVVGAMKRVAAPGDYRSNLHQGGSTEKVKLTKQEKDMAIKASKILGLKVAGVDIIRSDRGPLLLEVNSSPGLKGIESVTEKDIASLMIQSIEKKFGWINQ